MPGIYDDGLGNQVLVSLVALPTDASIVADATAAITTANLATAASITSLASSIAAAFGSLWSSISGAFTTLAAAIGLIPTAAAPTVAQIDTQLSGTHGSGAWSTAPVGENVRTITLTVTDASTPPNPIAGATVWCTSSPTDPTAIISNGTATTNSAGIAILTTITGPQYWWRMKPGVEFSNEPQFITVE